MSPQHYIIVTATIAVSMLLSHAYTQVLTPLQRLYVPNWIWLTVAIGDGFILGTQAILEYIFLIAPTTVLTGVIMAAWGLPIIRWQLEEWQERRRRNQTALEEGIAHASTKRSARSP